MEEVDAIILHFLRQLNIEINDNIKNISDLPVERIIESAARCISTINQNIKVPSKLPSGVSQKIEVAAQVASMCKDLGYQNDVGYQTFLYHNETELRQVFMFLIEKLPSEDKKPTTNIYPSNKKHKLLQDISYKIGEDLNTIWIPQCCKPTNKTTIGDFVLKQDKYTDTKLNLEEISRKLSKINEIRNAKKITEPIKDNVQIIDTKQKIKHYECDKSLSELKEIDILLRQRLDTLESERNLMDVDYTQAQKNCDRAKAELKNIQHILSSVGVVDIESDSVENIIEKVHEIIRNLNSKSEDLSSKNLSLNIEIAKLKANNTLNESERSKCKKILTNLMETAKCMKEECENKEEFRNQLKNKFEKLRGGNKRHIYTKRILEIIGNVVKQNAEIKKVLEDTRQLQKEINTLEGQLDRCFSIADETLFKDAKKDDQAKKAYKLLALLHSECNTIVTLVNDTGILSREIIDLEDNIKAEKSKRTEHILQKIQQDLSKLLNESR